MAHGVYIFHQILDPFHIVGDYGHGVMENVVDGYHGNTAVYQFQNLGRAEINAGDYHAVKLAVPAIFRIGDFPVADAVGEKGNAIAHGFGLCFDSLQNPGKEFVGQAVIGSIYEEDAKAVGTVCF